MHTLLRSLQNFHNETTFQPSDDVCSKIVGMWFSRIMINTRDFKHRRRERQRRREIVRENPNVTLRMSGGKYLDVLLRNPT